MKKCMHKIENMPFIYLFNFFLSFTDELVFPVKSSVKLYSDRKPRACQKFGVGKCLVPGQRKICKCPTPGIDKASKCPILATSRLLKILRK